MFGKETEGNQGAVTGAKVTWVHHKLLEVTDVVAMMEPIYSTAIILAVNYSANILYDYSFSCEKGHIVVFLDQLKLECCQRRLC